MGGYRAERPMGIQDIVDGLGIKSGTLGAQRNRAQRRAGSGRPAPGDLPEADGYISGKSPWWYESTLVEWAVRAGHVPPTVGRSWDAVVAQVAAQGGAGLWDREASA